MNKSFFILFHILVLCLIIPKSMAQTNNGNNAQSNLFDFWVGHWNLTWQNKDGSTSHGTNDIEKIMDGHVIQEHFKADDGPLAGFKGMSVTVYNPNFNLWRQTWVDNEGAYLDFTGKFEGEKRIFERSFTNKAGKKIYQRMVFYNIRNNSFDWDWENTTDTTQNWNLRWKIHYERRK